MSKEKELQKIINRMARDSRKAHAFALELYGSEAQLFAESEGLYVMDGDEDSGGKARQAHIKLQANGQVEHVPPAGDVSIPRYWMDCGDGPGVYPMEDLDGEWVRYKDHHSEVERHKVEANLFHAKQLLAESHLRNTLAEVTQNHILEQRWVKELAEMAKAPSYMVEHYDGQMRLNDDVNHWEWFRWNGEGRPINKAEKCDVVLTDGRVLFGQSPYSVEWHNPTNVLAARYSSCKTTAEAEPQCLLCLDKKTIPGNIPTGGFVKDCPDCCGEEG